MNIKLHPKTIFKANLYLILFLIVTNIVGVILTYYFDYENIQRFIRVFDLNTEKNIPTLYSSTALMVSSLLLMSIAFSRKHIKSTYIMWLVLGVIFAFLSIDEIFSIHERLGTLLRDELETSGVLFFAWIIPYSIGLLAFVMAYSKFLLELPKDTMVLFIVSGATFVSGAIGFEMLGGRQAELHGITNIRYAIYYTCEESLEMAAIALFIYTLFTYIVNQFESIGITVSKRVD